MIVEAAILTRFFVNCAVIYFDFATSSVKLFLYGPTKTFSSWKSQRICNNVLFPTKGMKPLLPTHCALLLLSFFTGHSLLFFLNFWFCTLLMSERNSYRLDFIANRLFNSKRELRFYQKFQPSVRVFNIIVKLPSCFLFFVFSVVEQAKKAPFFFENYQIHNDK